MHPGIQHGGVSAILDVRLVGLRLIGFWFRLRRHGRNATDDELGYPDNSPGISHNFPLQGGNKESRWEGTGFVR